MNTLTRPAGITNGKQEGSRGLDRTMGRIALRARHDALDTPGDSDQHVDVAEMSDVVVVKAEMPGLYPDEIEVSLRGRTLTIQGWRDRQIEGKDEWSHGGMQGTLGVFLRALRLPAAVDVAKASASFASGLLTVVLPKTPAAEGTAIPIKVA
jgi:HSP20 family protein